VRTSLERSAVAGPSIEAVVKREKLKRHWRKNKGAVGIDDRNVGDLPAYLRE
jgi:hypothetical protein